MFNWPIVLLASLVPLIVGFIWYNKAVFGTTWMKATGMTEENAKGANMPLLFGLTFLFSFFLAIAIHFVVIHQYHVYSIFANDTSVEAQDYVKGFMDKYGNNFRTFKHGVFHGVEFGILMVLPIVAINALFERKSFKYIFIHAGYWTVCLALMGGIICAYAK